MPYTADSPILGEPAATMQQCITFMTRRPSGEYNATDIATVIVPTYFELCRPIGLDPVIMLAQMVHETGNMSAWWSQRPRRNPAGIGVTGASSPTQPTSGAWVLNDGVWYEGVSFNSWKDDSIPAHVGRALAYALTDADANAEQRAAIARALSYRPLSKFRGVATTIRGFNGRWAVPGTTYADKLALIGVAMSKS